MNKTELRKEITAKLKSLDQDKRRQASAKITERFLAIEAFKKSNVIMAFHGDKTEVDTVELIQACLSAGKRVALPRTQKETRRMQALEISDFLADTEDTRFDFREPKANRPVVPLHELDLILVPGRAFDEAGNRLGRGAGYYDRFLAHVQSSVTLIGLAFDFQVVQSVPTTDCDHKVGQVITERQWIKM